MENRNFIPLTRERDILTAIQPSMRWDGKENFALWQKRARARLGELIGMPYEKCDPSFAVEFEKDHGDYTEISFSFQTEPNYFIPCHLLLPKGVKRPGVMLCLQGHAKGQHISLGVPLYEGDAHSIAGGRDFAIQSVKHGLAAFTMDQRGFGQCGGTADGPQCLVPAATALLMGRTMIGERVWDVSRAIDLLETVFADKVDASKVFCMGNSGGGTTAFYAACMEERIRLAVPSCAVCTYAASIGAMEHCVCNYIPRIALDFDMGDLAGLIAPRPMVIVCGKDDDIFPLYGVKESYALAEKAYGALGASDLLHLVVGYAGHRFYPDEAWPLMDGEIAKL